MSFKKQETSNYLFLDTPVENLFISQYAASAPGDYVKVFLLGLMYANLGRPAENPDLARELGLSAKDVDDAWEYWSNAGIVNKRAKSSRKTAAYDVEFVSIKENLTGPAPEKKAGRVSEVITSREARELFLRIEGVTGRLLEGREPEAIVSWIKDFGIDPELIFFAYDYCAKSASSSSFRYVEKVVKAWNEQGISSVEMAEDFLGAADRHRDFYKGVFRIMGFRRNPTQQEKELMDSWSDKLGLTLADIREACRKTSGINNPNLNYVNAILVSGANGRQQKEEEKGRKKTSSVEYLYEKIREENAEKADRQRAMVYEKVPELGAVMQALKESGMAAAELLLSGRKDSFLKERERQSELLKKKNTLLLAAGFPETALDPIYTCSICKDTGITEDGTRCSCYGLRLQETDNE